MVLTLNFYKIVVTRVWEKSSDFGIFFFDFRASLGSEFSVLFEINSVDRNRYDFCYKMCVCVCVFVCALMASSPVEKFLTYQIPL